MYDSIVLTLIFAMLLWIAVCLQIISYVVRRFLKMYRRMSPARLLSSSLPTRKELNVPILKFVAVKIALYMTVRHFAKKLR